MEQTPEQLLKINEAVLRTKETDWEDIFIKLRMSAIGNEFPIHKFVRTPVSVIKRLLERINDEEQRRANIAALTSAHVAQLIVATAHGFSGSKGAGPRTKPKDFLPFPDWVPLGLDSNTGPDEGTRFVLSQLIKQGLLPAHVFTALISPPENGG